VRLSILPLLWLRSGILRRFWRRLRIRPNASSWSLIHFLRRSVLRSFLLLLHSADDFGAVPNRHVFKRARDVVPVFGATISINSGRVITRTAPVQCQSTHGLSLISAFSRNA